MRNLLILLLPSLTLAYDFTCNLHCFNGGECRHGKGKFGNYAGVHEDEMMPWETTITESSMYCSCPVGYTGLQCEIKHVVCGEDGVDSHTCFNGSECKKERSGNGKLYFRCECDPENSIMTASYAGKYCEHIATVFCGVREGDSSLGGSPSYCTNGGKCKEKESEEQNFIGCICPESWTGSHCQTAVVTADTEDLLHMATSKTSVGRIVGFLILSVFGVTGILMCLDNRKKKKEKKKRREDAKHAGRHYRDRKNAQAGEMA
eukprot:CAMPEP_0117058654 /NCGR_PEP_ID=MMETSP0472-20121206/40747_1 /TAXON_ID=693140 ORGANISM="Tiarina fusus, Strain LIS" /NCGR_SAMPLE_ID=MMETSP0472 /ASSEMBLY_ACC=CAM_ASM_000603 /LENGTH=260 /DNA_ID=CAMNT_0004776065 /DNA_START=101 /DNA_END=883 /DNA_ORIENTATION=+